MSQNYPITPYNTWRARMSRARYTAAGAVGAAGYMYARGTPTLRSLEKNYRSAKYLYNQAFGGKPKDSFKKTNFERRKKNVQKSFPKKIKAQIKHLKDIAEADTGTLTYRKRSTNQLLAAENQQAMKDIAGSSTALVEAALNECRYYNISTPATLAVPTITGSVNKSYLVESTYSKLTIRNNYQVPCKLKVYLCKPKSDTSNTPSAFVTSGLTDSSNGSISNTNMYATDSPHLTEAYSIVKTKTYEIQAGKEIQCTHSEKEFNYSPDFVDSHALTYQKAYKAFVWLLVLQGTLAHDSVINTEQGITQSSIDILVDLVYKIKYNAGMDLKYTYIDQSLDTFTNSAVVSNKPTSDNQSYSVA